MLWLLNITAVIENTLLDDKQQHPIKYYYRFMLKDLNHKGFKYKLGLNVDTEPFYPYGSCEGGGLYYTDIENLSIFYNKFGTLIAKVSPAINARIYQDPSKTKYKTDKLIVWEITPFADWFKKQSNCIFIKDHPETISYLDDPVEYLQEIAFNVPGTQGKKYSIH